MPKLLVDSTAARLSRWLRFLGVDAVLDRSRSTARLLLCARREGRVLVTRRRKLEGASPGEVIFLQSDHLTEQLEQVATVLGLSGALSPRCTVCNEELRIVPRSFADGRVPEFVYCTQKDFAYCNKCDRFYWKGSHWKKVRDSSRSILKDPSETEQNP